MDNTPRHLKAKRIALVHRPELPVDEASWAAITLPRHRTLVRRIRVIRRALLAALWTALCLPVQAILLLVPGKSKIVFPQIFWTVLCGLIGLNVRIIGTVATRTDDCRPVVFVCNHSSWLDIGVLGGLLQGCFIAKEEVGTWPVIRTIARLGRTLYVRRSRSSTGRERDDMVRRLSLGDNLILFPEGTTSDGARVLPFRSAFLSVAELAVTPAGRTPIVQPVSVVYDRVDSLPMGRASRPLYAWFGDMDIGSHFWRLAQHEGLRVTVLLHEPLDPELFPSRKALAAATWAIVADGASTLRQNRPASPAASTLQRAALV